MRFDLDALFASAPSPYVLLDPELRIVWANLAYLHVTGRDRDTLIGRIITEEFPAPPDTVSDQMLRASFRRVLATGKTDHLPLIPYPIVTNGGQLEERYWSATHTPILGAQGRVEFILQNTMDVTDLYQSERAATSDSLPKRAALLERAEAIANENLALGAMTEFFQSAFDQAPSLMAILSGPDHVFRIANQTYLDLIGREVEGLPVREALPETEGQDFAELLDQVYASGESVSLKGMAALFRPDSKDEPIQRFVDIFFHALKDNSGNSIGIFVQGHDVTGQKIAEADLAATREKFRSMAQTMPNHVWTADLHGGLTWLNDQTYAFTGHNEGELYGADWARVVHPDDLDTAAKEWTGAIQNGVGYETEFRIRKADGSYRWHLVRASPLRANDGTLAGWVGTNTDIEDRKNTEAEIAKLNDTLETRVAMRNQELEKLHATLRQSQKMEAIGGLAGGIAHDFNNLLQVITGNLQLVAREMPEGSPAHARIDQAMSSVMRGATLASQLLSFARKQPLAPKVIKLSRLLENTVDMLRSAIGDGVALEMRLSNDLWNTNVDSTNLENAVLNLAINARDAMNGQGTLTVSLENANLDGSYGHAHPDIARGQYVVLSVSDTGCGIQPAMIEKIFEPFFTTKEDGHGTGLGLSMVYGFAKQSGGHVTIDSEVGTGTTIKIYLPRSLEEEHDIVPDQTGGMFGGSETILLVEDDSEVRATAVHMLSDLGYEILQAANADQALAMLENDAQFDLLFTDVMMPGQATARELAEQVRGRFPRVPVLYTSGYVQDSIFHDGRLDAGVQLLSKPYTQTTLAQKIREVLGSGGTRAQVGPKADAAAVGQHAPDEPPQIEGLRVLVCEDDVLILTDIAEMLRAAGCTVLEAANASTALDILKSDTVALLITDVGLPDRSGVELAQDARELDPALPVIFATGGADVPAARTLGNCVVLSKPFHEAQLLETVETALSESCASLRVTA